MIEATEQLVQFLDSIPSHDGEIVCAVDTEADSLHRYSESLCLIQFAVGEECRLIDPLAIKDLSPLMDFLRNSTVWMHGADYDMTMLKRVFDEVPAVVFDTQIGARLLGARKFGLANLVEDYFGITLTKTSQKADWGKRPLSEKMVEYALNDVAYLIEMGDRIVARLKELGRYEWFVESCEVARDKVLERSESRDDLWRIQGAGKLSREGLAYLRALWHWRNSEAESWDRPTFMVANNRQLISWSTELSSGKKAKLPRHYRPNRVKRFNAAVEETKALDESEWPIHPKSPRIRKPKDFEQRLKALIEKRDQVAGSLDIEGSLIAPRATLEALAANLTDAGESLMKWQRECLDL